MRDGRERDLTFAELTGVVCALAAAIAAIPFLLRAVLG